MDLNTFRNTMREWVRTKVNETDSTRDLPLVVPNEGSSFGVDAEWLRYSLQLGEAEVVGIGTLQKRRRRIGRVFVEVFGPLNVGEGSVSQRATDIENFLRQATTGATAPHQDILILEPSTFERPEGGRYCQVVSAPIQVDHVS